MADLPQTKNQDESNAREQCDKGKENPPSFSIHLALNERHQLCGAGPWMCGFGTGAILQETCKSAGQAVVLSIFLFFWDSLLKPRE